MNISPLAVLNWREFKTTERALFVVSVLCGVSYLFTPSFFSGAMRPFWPVNAAIKTLAVATLAGLAFRQLVGREKILLTTALAFSSLGDLFLALRNGNYFVFGLSSFLVAHLFFIALWRRSWSQPLRPTTKQKIIVALLVLFLLTMLGWMLPIPGLSVPVAVYMCVLTAMVICAALADFKTDWIWAGAILFLLSDSIIGLNTFKHIVQGNLAAFLIWSTYYAAQYFMTFGFFGARQHK